MEEGKKRRDRYAEVPQAAPYTRKEGPDLALVAPLIYGPMLPIIRITFKNRPVLRDRLFFSCIGLATVHGFYVILSRYA